MRVSFKILIAASVLLYFGTDILHAAIAVEPNTLGSVKVVPNPWRSDKDSGQSIAFENLPQNTTIKIFTVSGHLVTTLGPSADTIPWDLTNFSGDKVASGIYLYLATAGNEKIDGKLAIIR